MASCVRLLNIPVRRQISDWYRMGGCVVCVCVAGAGGGGFAVCAAPKNSERRPKTCCRTALLITRNQTNYAVGSHVVADRERDARVASQRRQAQRAVEHIVDGDGTEAACTPQTHGG